MNDNMRSIYALTAVLLIGFLATLSSSVLHSAFTNAAPTTTKHRSIVNAWQIVLFIIYFLSAAQYVFAVQRNEQSPSPQPLDCNKFCYALIFTYAACLNFILWHTKHIATAPACVTFLTGIAMHYAYALLFLIDTAPESNPDEPALDESESPSTVTSRQDDSTRSDDTPNDAETSQCACARPTERSEHQ
jgi:hypothetical protein